MTTFSLRIRHVVAAVVPSALYVLASGCAGAEPDDTSNSAVELQSELTSTPQPASACTPQPAPAWKSDPRVIEVDAEVALLDSKNDAVEAGASIAGLENGPACKAGAMCWSKAPSVPCGPGEHISYDYQPYYEGRLDGALRVLSWQNWSKKFFSAKTYFSANGKPIFMKTKWLFGSANKDDKSGRDGLYMRITYYLDKNGGPYLAVLQKDMSKWNEDTHASEVTTTYTTAWKEDAPALVASHPGSYAPFYSELTAGRTLGVCCPDVPEVNQWGYDIDCHNVYVH